MQGSPTPFLQPAAHRLPLSFSLITFPAFLCPSHLPPTLQTEIEKRKEEAERQAMEKERELEEQRMAAEQLAREQEERRKEQER